MTLKEVIERLEKAECGSRELDCAVAEAAGTVPPRLARACGPEGMCFVGTTQIPGSNPDDRWVPPTYTTSLDAALTLVPEEYDYEVIVARNGNDPFCEAACYPKPYMKCPTEDEITAQAKTGALALCIAALKARTA